MTPNRTQALEVGDDCVEIEVLELVLQQIRLTSPDPLQQHLRNFLLHWMN